MWWPGGSRLGCEVASFYPATENLKISNLVYETPSIDLRLQRTKNGSSVSKR
jgi:hypothetical protein